MIPVAKPFASEEEAAHVRDVILSGMMASGDVVHEFEQKFAEYCDTNFGVATTNANKPVAMSNCVFINNINISMIKEAAWPGSADAASSTKKGAYTNCMYISPVWTWKTTGLAFKDDGRGLCPNPNVGTMGDSLDRTAFNSEYWTTYDYDTQMSGYVALGFVCMPRVMPAVDQWNIAFPPVIHQA